RDLYGSSYILSFLAWAVCRAAKQQGHTVISPALINVTQGMPNQIIIDGIFEQAEAKPAFNEAWGCIVYTCRQWIEDELSDTYRKDDYCWHRDWGLWAKHAWEFFAANGSDIPTARRRLNDCKQSRAWTGINWTGESSTLSGADAIAWPKLGYNNPRKTSYQDQKHGIETFYKTLSKRLGEAFIDPDEELSVPEVIKRMVTHEEVAKAVLKTFKARSHTELTQKEEVQLLQIANELNPRSFKDLNRLKQKDRKPDQPTEPKYWTGWFLGDGDNAGKYLKRHSTPEVLTAFSAQMREWGSAIRDPEQSYLPGQGRMVYAGGDDFLGVLYERDAQLQSEICWQWLSQFNKDFWRGRTLQARSASFKYKANKPKPITASVGFVWAAPNVPQRDVLQHCHAAEQSAKRGGRDRIAFRILFNGGNHLEWVCPWWVLEDEYIDISKNQLGLAKPQAWTHFYNDAAALEGRHAFGANQDGPIDVAKALFQVYFGEASPVLDEAHWWNRYDANERLEFSGILGDATRFAIADPDHPDYGKPLAENRFVRKAINTWVINLAKAGFQLTRPVRSSQPAAA
ncbi:MAG: CRISPR-associated protein, partial [Leptolyngbya sp. SIO4C1]|nr:CRISPR-associated protein [Leptolyngbya sp. SIO4C1]